MAIGSAIPSVKFHVNGGTGNQIGLFESTDATVKIGFKDYLNLSESFINSDVYAMSFLRKTAGCSSVSLLVHPYLVAQ